MTWGTLTPSSLKSLKVLTESHGLSIAAGDLRLLDGQGVQLLERLSQDDRIEISQPSRNTQTKLVRSLPNGNDFVAYVDAIGELDGNRCILEWKTTTCRYPEEPSGLLALDPQLICYSWIQRDLRRGVGRVCQKALL
jgi:hypothetical protein